MNFEERLKGKNREEGLAEICKQLAKEQRNWSITAEEIYFLTRYKIIDKNGECVLIYDEEEKRWRW